MTNSPGHALSLVGHQPGHAPWFSLRAFVLVLIVLAVIVILLVGPLLAGALYEMLCKGGERAAPGTFVVGLGVLVTGLVFGSKILIIAGAGLIGAIVIGFLLDNYLPSARYSPFRVGMYQSAGALAAAGPDAAASPARPARRATGRPGNHNWSRHKSVTESDIQPKEWQHGLCQPGNGGRAFRGGPGGDPPEGGR